MTPADPAGDVRALKARIRAEMDRRGLSILRAAEAEATKERTGMTYNPITEALPYDAAGVCVLTGEAGENADDCTTHEHEPLGQQPAYHAVVHLLVPCFDAAGNPVTSQAEAEDYIAETLRGQFLDWGYVHATDPETGDVIEGPEGMQSPVEITVCRPYIEGTFGNEDS